MGMNVGQPLRWTLRALVALLLLVLRAREFPPHKSVGIPTKIPSATCSAELLDRPLIFRVLPNGEVALGVDLMSKPEAMDRLPGIRAATYERTLLFYADASLAFGDVVGVLSDVRAQLPRWNILIVSPPTYEPCKQWIDAHSGPAA